MERERGFALVLTLVILAFLTTLVVEFAYGVYVATSGLYNWRDSQRLSGIARSGVSLAIGTLSDAGRRHSYSYPDKIEVPVDNAVEGFTGTLVISVSDENARLNINSLVYKNGTVNRESEAAFRRLFRLLQIDDKIINMLIDWIDKNTEPLMSGSEEGAKNAPLDTVEELGAIRGIDAETVNRLMPYVTVYGINGDEDHLININTASTRVIMSLDDRITEELARTVITYRNRQPFEKIGDLVKVPGFEGALGQSLMNRIAVKSSHFRIISLSAENRVERIIECVAALSGGNAIIRYWKEI